MNVNFRRYTISAVLVAMTVFTAGQAATGESHTNDSIPGWKHWTKQLEQLDAQLIGIGFRAGERSPVPSRFADLRGILTAPPADIS